VSNKKKAKAARPKAAKPPARPAPPDGADLSAWLASAPKSAGLRNPKTRARVMRQYPALQEMADLADAPGDVTVDEAADLLEKIYDLCEAVYGPAFGAWIESVPVALQEGCILALFNQGVPGLGKD